MFQAGCRRSQSQDFSELQKAAQSKQEFFISSEEQEGHVTSLFGESSSTFVTRVSGNAVLEARLGTNIDLAMSAWQENVRVMVVNTHSLYT